MNSTEKNRRGHQSREEHNQAREFKARRRFEAPAARQERKRIFGYYEDKTGRTFTKAQIERFVDQIREGHVPTDAVDKDSLVHHPPESQKDMIDSIGEVYIPRLASYPALGIGEGEVIRDPKIPFEHPVLKCARGALLSLCVIAGQYLYELGFILAEAFVSRFLCCLL